MKPGCFKIGNTGGMLDNILSSKLYRPGRLVNSIVILWCGLGITSLPLARCVVRGE